MSGVRYVVCNYNNVNIFGNFSFIWYSDAEEYVKTKMIKEYRICVHPKDNNKDLTVIQSTYSFDNIIVDNDSNLEVYEKVKYKYNHKAIIVELELNGLNCDRFVNLCDYFPFSGKFLYRLNGENKSEVMNILINIMKADVKDLGNELIFELKKDKYKMEKKQKKEIEKFIEFNDSLDEIDGVSEEEIEEEFDDGFYCDDDFDESCDDEKLDENEGVNFNF